MIRYQAKGAWKFLNLFRLKGSAFPYALCFAGPCALAAGLLKHLIRKGVMESVMGWDSDHQFLYDNAPWNGFTFLVGFLTVFRTSQSYMRYWEACTSSWEMRAQWFDAASALVSFLRYSDKDEEAQNALKHVIVRLFSLLHAAALAELREKELAEDEEFEHGDELLFNVIDPQGLAGCLEVIEKHPCKVSVVFQWIQVTIVDNVKSGMLSIPPPILSRVFQQLGEGMVVFHDAAKISEVPIPFPYAQACDFLLLLHWLLTPIIIQTWTSTPWWAATFSFLMVLTYWSLNAIAVTIEMPFGTDDNDLNFEEMQHDMNSHLLVLLMPSMKDPPMLAPSAMTHASNDIHSMAKELFGEYQFQRVSRSGRRHRISHKSTGEELDARGKVSSGSGLSKSTGTITMSQQTDMTHVSQSVEPQAAEVYTRVPVLLEESAKFGSEAWATDSNGPFSTV
mmetsp:Transcript_38096/g.89236  ORF Transcript_38096/g.89236 Transcript_38096/m.89236 type:complete len:450 (-) Transcript_38096:189-1538(-)